jgi:hypothetical protein
MARRLTVSLLDLIRRDMPVEELTDLKRIEVDIIGIGQIAERTST